MTRYGAGKYRSAYSRENHSNPLAPEGERAVRSIMVGEGTEPVITFKVETEREEDGR